MLSRTAIAATAVLLISPLCLAQDQSGAATAARTNQDATAVANTADAHTSTKDEYGGIDVEFFKGCASDNTLEIRLAQMALQKCDDPAVKQVAQMMITDHTAANEMIKKISDEKALAVSTDQLSITDQAEYDALALKQGPTFLHQFLFDQVGGHTKDVLNVAYHANHADPVTQQYANAVLPKIRMHLRALEAIAYPMSGEAMPNRGDTAP
jgi:putative membrane protein